MIHQRFAFWSQLPLPFLNPTCISGSYLFTYRSEVWRVLNITLLICEMGIINSNYLLILSWIKQVPDAYLFSGLASLQRKEAILLNKWFVCGSQWVRGWPVSLFVFNLFLFCLSLEILPVKLLASFLEDHRNSIQASFMAFRICSFLHLEKP